MALTIVRRAIGETVARPAAPELVSCGEYAEMKEKLRRPLRGVKAEGRAEIKPAL